MLRNRKKDEEKKKKQNIEDLPENYTPEKEKLIEAKMEEIVSSIDKESEKKKVDLSSIPKDLSELEIELQKEQTKKKQPISKTQIKSTTTPVTAKFKPEMKDILPVWIEKPYYYITPAEKFQERRKLWQKEWADFLNQWANAKDKYVVELLALQKEYPFKNPVINKQLSNNQLQLIGDFLTETNNALWKNKNKTHLRIYWEPLEETAEKIYEWAFERAQKYIGVFDIMDSKQVFADLSSDEIMKCLIILVNEKKGEWADKKKEMVYLLFPV